MKPLAVRKILAPKDLVIPAKRWTMRVRILTRRRVRTEVKRNVNVLVHLYPPKQSQRPRRQQPPTNRIDPGLP